MRPNWENECVNKSALIEWLRPYLHTGEPIPADVLMSDIQMMPPTLTPQNEWVSVEERLPEDKQRVIVRCEHVGTSVGWILWGNWMTDIGPGAGKVTHWMPLPAPPGKDNNVPTKEQNEPLTIEQLREMDGDPVYLLPMKWWALVDSPKGLKRVILRLSGGGWGAFYSNQDLNRYAEAVYRRPPKRQGDA